MIVKIQHSKTCGMQVKSCLQGNLQPQIHKLEIKTKGQWSWYSSNKVRKKIQQIKLKYSRRKEIIKTRKRNFMCNRETLKSQEWFSENTKCNWKD